MHPLRIAIVFGALLPVVGCSKGDNAPSQVSRRAEAAPRKPTPSHSAKQQDRTGPRTLADLMDDDSSKREGETPLGDFPPLATSEPPKSNDSPSTDASFPPLAQETTKQFREIDEARAAAAGIRKLVGKHLVLFTDVESAPAVEELPTVFDAAFPRWCRHLGLDEKSHGDWQMRGFLIKDRERFEATGLWPENLPNFLNGYTRGREFWLYNQSSDYYRRHLMLHEGVHGIMFTLQRSSGPAWYMEGIAELLATHQWEDGRLTLPHFPARPADVPKLGRIEIVQQDFTRGKAKYLRDVLAFENRMYLENEPYAWSWAAAAFLYGHPAYRQRFREMTKRPAYRDFNEKLGQAYADDSQQLHEEWQVFVGELAHGYDFARTRLDFSPAKFTPQADMPVKLTVAADRGWQNTGVRLEAGVRYKLTAGGQYTLAAEPKPWISEPNGVTIRYHRGLPLGILLAVVRPHESQQGPSPFFKPNAIGLGATIEAEHTGTLYLRINDFAGELADNTGAAEVTVSLE